MLSLPSVREKCVNTCIEKYGVSNPSQADSIKEKKSKTAKETFAKRGEEINLKRSSTNMEKRGVPWPMMSQEVKDKSIATFARRYGEGVRNSMSIKEVVEKTDFVKAAIKRHATMKKNGTYKTSKPENVVYQVLCNKYGEENILRQSLVEQWPIDFYVKSIYTYVQVDGTYWHGLNKTFKELEESSNPRDRVILQKKKTDIKQNDWFEKHFLKLVRITEDQVKRGDFQI